MPQKRKPFFIRGNFQVKFILCFVAVLSLGILVSTVLIYRAAAGAFERAAFSSHLGWVSSADLVREIIVGVNLKVGLACILAGLAAVVFMHFCLQRFFAVLANDLMELATGKFSSRLQGVLVFLDRPLAQQYNKMADEMHRNYLIINEINDKSLAAIERQDPDMVRTLKRLAEEFTSANCP